MKRRLALGVSIILALGCSRGERAARDSEGTQPSASASSKGPRVWPAEENTWNYDVTDAGPMSVVVLSPESLPGEQFPVLVAMHGRGETGKGVQRGARGWVDDYEIKRAIQRLKKPPLVKDDFKTFVSDARLSRLNQALAEKPYRGMVLAFPYTPTTLMGEKPFAKALPLAGFIVGTLLPRLYREAPTINSVAATGIDGVSLGGRTALTIGLLHPESFGAVAALQAAFDMKEIPEFVARAKEAKRTSRALKIRLLTSSGDSLKDENTALADALKQAGVEAQFDVAEGPHDYEFNRGPGAIEMLMFHDRVLRGEPPP